MDAFGVMNPSSPFQPVEMRGSGQGDFVDWVLKDPPTRQTFDEIRRTHKHPEDLEVAIRREGDVVSTLFVSLLFRSR